MSKKEVWYVQCRFETKTSEGTKVDTAWIPEKFAKVGKKIYLGKKRPNPEELWRVTHTFDRKPASWLFKHEMDFKHQRKASDI